MRLNEKDEEKLGEIVADLERLGALTDVAKLAMLIKAARERKVLAAAE